MCIRDRYYIYDPDVEENADIFFNEVLGDVIDFTKYGLTNLRYTILDCKQRAGYIQYRIVT